MPWYLFHVSSVVLSLSIVLVADKYALDWFLGKKMLLDARLLRVLHALVWTGLIFTMLFGFLMAYPLLPYLLGQPIFLAKMLFVGLLITNAFIIGSLMQVATERPYAALTQRERVPLFISGAVSTISWASAALLGLYLF